VRKISLLTEEHIAKADIHHGRQIQFLRISEGQLGLSFPDQAEVLRALRLLRKLDVEGAFWAESAAKDPLATALRLLRWNEELRLAGWHGQAVSPRLGQLSALMEGSPPGIAGRVARVIEALQVQEVDLDSIELLGMSRGELPVLFRHLLEALEAGGTVITEKPLETTEGSGDLAGCLEEGYSPAGSGELRMIRPQGPIAAADLVAAWLAGLDDLTGTVIIGGDEVLDNALHRYGLPTLGASRSAGGDSLLQILSLVIALGWAPQDPHVALELLSLPESPVPPGIAHRLIEALRQWPAIGSNDWNERLASGIEAITEEDRRRRVRERLAILFTPGAEGDEFPAAGLDQRVGTIETWAKGMAQNAGEQEWRWDCLLRQLSSFRKLFCESGLENLPKPLVEKLVVAATSQISLPPAHAAQAGLVSVDDPGAVLCPVRRVVWWNFTERIAPSVDQPFLAPEEKASLEALGCEFPEPAELAARNSRAWRRPLQMASEAVLLVCPRFGADGEPESPHPLWDEIVSGLERDQAAKLVGEMPCGVSACRKVEALPVPVPKKEWHVIPPVRIGYARPFSPSVLERLLGNPLYWVLEYPGRLRAGRFDPLSSGPLLMGSLTHEIVGGLLAECVEKKLHDPDEVFGIAGGRFDALGPGMAAGFFMPGQERERARLRHTVASVARDLFRHISENGATVKAVEATLEGEIDGIALKGRPDLVLGNPDIVLDMKWGRMGDRRKELEEGGALQLAVYAALLRRRVSIGYYITEKRSLLVCGPSGLDGTRVEGPEPGEVWEAASEAIKERLEQFGEGLVEDTCALASGDELPKNSRLLDGRLVIAPRPERFALSWISGGTVEG
jgi:hypothetical protein